MAENRNIEYGVLNIAATPHPEGVYREIFEKAAHSQVGFWGDLHATISRPSDVGDGFFSGRVYIWTEIDESEPAINTQKLEEVDFSDLDIELPENIGFNGRVFTYIFRERDHALFVETRNELGKRISPIRLQKIFRRLFSPEILGIDASIVEVTVYPEEDALRRILGLHTLKRIHIHIVRPNADDFDAQDILDELEEQGAKSQDLNMAALPGPDGLTLNDRTKTQAEVGSYNGFVEASGVDEDGERVHLSTKQYPRIIRRVLEEMGSTFGQALAVAKDTVLRRPSD